MKKIIFLIISLFITIIDFAQTVVAPSYSGSYPIEYISSRKVIPKDLHEVDVYVTLHNFGTIEEACIEVQFLGATGEWISAGLEWDVSIEKEYEFIKQMKGLDQDYSINPPYTYQILIFDCKLGKSGNAKKTKPQNSDQSNNNVSSGTYNNSNTNKNNSTKNTNSSNTNTSTNNNSSTNTNNKTNTTTKQNNNNNNNKSSSNTNNSTNTSKNNKQSTNSTNTSSDSYINANTSAERKKAILDEVDRRNAEVAAQIENRNKQQQQQQQKNRMSVEEQQALQRQLDEVNRQKEKELQQATDKFVGDLANFTASIIDDANEAHERKIRRRLDEIIYYESEKKKNVIQSKLDMWNETNEGLQNALVSVNNYEFHLMDLADQPKKDFGNLTIRDFNWKKECSKWDFTGLPVYGSELAVVSYDKYENYSISPHYSKKCDIFDKNNKLIFETKKSDLGDKSSLYISDNGSQLIQSHIKDFSFNLMISNIYTINSDFLKNKELIYHWGKAKDYWDFKNCIFFDLKFSPKNRYIIWRYKPERTLAYFKTSNWSAVYIKDQPQAYERSISFIDINKYSKKQDAFIFKSSLGNENIYAFEFLPNSDEKVICIGNNGEIFMTNFEKPNNIIKIDGRMDLVGTSNLKENSALNHIIKISNNQKYFVCCTMYAIEGSNVELNKNKLGYVVQLYDLENKKLIGKLPLDFKMVYDVQFKENMLYVMGTDKYDVFINKTYNPDIIKQNMQTNSNNY